MYLLPNGERWWEITDTHTGRTHKWLVYDGQWWMMQIEDRHGNTIDFTWGDVTFTSPAWGTVTHRRIVRVDDSFGRSVLLNWSFTGQDLDVLRLDCTLPDSSVVGLTFEPIYTVATELPWQLIDQTGVVHYDYDHQNGNPVFSQPITVDPRWLTWSAGSP